MVLEKKNRCKMSQKIEGSFLRLTDLTEKSSAASSEHEYGHPSFEESTRPTPKIRGVANPFVNILPANIRPIPARIATDDLEFLHKKGAFTIPDTNLRNQLLHAYVQFVHPFLPIIDLEDFLTSIERNQPTNTISLFLFQAVMFAGAAHVDVKDPASHGYRTQKDMQRALFKKLRLLYDFDYEDDRITILQSVLLMTYWYEDMDDPKDVLYWLDIAISMARSIDLNPHASEVDYKDSRSRRLRKRIWWSCFIRHRLIALDMSCRTLISLEKPDVPMLELSDFETRALPSELNQLLGGCSTVEDSGKRVALAKMCIALARLSVCIGPILNRQQYEPNELGAPRTNTIQRLSRSISINAHEALMYDGQLTRWYQKLNLQSLHNFTPGSFGRNSGVDCKAVHLHRALLAGIYLAVVIVLHRPLCRNSETRIAPELQGLAERKAREAANKITILYRDLFAHDLLGNLPYTGVTCVLFATDIHLHDIDSLDPATNVAGICKLRTCTRALERLRQRHSLEGLNLWLISAPMRQSIGTTGVADAMLVEPAAVKRTVLSSCAPSEHENHQSKRMHTESPDDMKTEEYQLCDPVWSLETTESLSAGPTPSLAGSDLSSCSTNMGRGTANSINTAADHDEHDIHDAIDPRKLTPVDHAPQNLPDGSIFCSASDDRFHNGLQWLQEFDVDLDYLEQPEGDIKVDCGHSPGQDVHQVGVT